MKLIAALFLVILPTVFCAGQGKHVKEVKYTIDPATGVKYRFIRHDKNGQKPSIGDFATLILMYRNDKDSVVFNSRTGPTRRKDDSIGVVTIPLKKTFNGCLEQGVTLMAVGDSAEFQFVTDSLFLKTFKAKSIPPFVHAGTMLTFDVKLVKFQTEAQIKEEQQKQVAMQQAEMQKRKSDEHAVIAKYLNDNKITVKPTADSIYVLQDTPGAGRAVADGDSVEVRYKGMFLDGKIFDQSSAHGGKGTFTFVYSQHAQLIQGWIKVIGAMHEGEKVTVLIPSSMGYGERGAGGLIQPFTPLLFDIEVVKLSK